LAQIAESAGCEYLTLYTDDLEYLAVDSTLVDLWTQAVAQIRTVFSGRLTSGSTWGTDCTSDSAFWTMSRPPQIAALQDVFGIAGFPGHYE
jgi:hypothetical protein